jgi:hypothetical protein
VAKRPAAAPAPEERYRQWHRWFGLLLTDHLTDSPFTVEVEKDLSQRVQRLDVVVVRRRPGPVTRPLPDGLDDFVAHNLITFKSFQEPLDDWALKELTGHYVNYRKQVSPKDRLLPEADFRLYAVCARHPRDLFRAVAPTQRQEGVYDLQRGTDEIRIVVASDLPTTERNALLHLFSAAPDRVEYGATHYRFQTDHMSSIVSELFEGYQRERLPMPYTMQDFVKEFVRKHLDELSAEERLAGLKVEERLAGLKVEDRLAGLSEAQIEAVLHRRRRQQPAPKKRTPKKGR